MKNTLALSLKFRAGLLQKGISVADAAAIAGVSVNTAYRFYRGDGNSTLVNAHALLRAVDMDLYATEAGCFFTNRPEGMTNHDNSQLAGS